MTFKPDKLLELKGGWTLLKTAATAAAAGEEIEWLGTIVVGGTIGFGAGAVFLSNTFLLSFLYCFRYDRNCSFKAWKQ